MKEVQPFETLGTTYSVTLHHAPKEWVHQTSLPEVEDSRPVSGMRQMLSQKSHLECKIESNPHNSAGLKHVEGTLQCDRFFVVQFVILNTV